MKVTNVKWFSHLDKTIGIVTGEDDITGEKKAYIGVGVGINEEADIDMICKLGSKFPIKAAEALL